MDASGNENNFHDENFTLEDIYDYLEGDWLSNTIATSVTNISRFYNGKFSTTTAGGGNNAATTNSSAGATIEFNTSIPFSEKVEVVGSITTEGSSSSHQYIYVKLNDVWIDITNNIRSDSPYKFTGNFKISYYEGSGFLQGVKFQANAVGNSGGVDAMLIDGKIYLQTGQPEFRSYQTRCSTPIKNYAVLETGKNGNPRCNC